MENHGIQTSFATVTIFKYAENFDKNAFNMDLNQNAAAFKF